MSITSPTTDALEARCEAIVRDGRGDTAHDGAHVVRVVATAKRLAAIEGARMDVIVPAAWLHDCVTVPKDSRNRPLASRMAASRAAALLSSWGVDPAIVSQVEHAIEAHSFTAGIPPRTLEARVVQDADRLDALGAVGLSRCLMLAGAMGKPLTSPEDPFCESRPPDDTRSAVDHFYTKLLGLAGTMQTATGREEARRCTDFLRSFLQQLRSEL